MMGSMSRLCDGMFDLERWDSIAYAYKQMDTYSRRTLFFRIILKKVPHVSRGKKGLNGIMNLYSRGFKSRSVSDVHPSTTPNPTPPPPPPGYQIIAS